MKSLTYTHRHMRRQAQPQFSFFSLFTSIYFIWYHFPSLTKIHHFLSPSSTFQQHPDCFVCFWILSLFVISSIPLIGLKWRASPSKDSSYKNGQEKHRNYLDSYSNVKHEWKENYHTYYFCGQGISLEGISKFLISQSHYLIETCLFWALS